MTDLFGEARTEAKRKAPPPQRTTCFGAGIAAFIGAVTPDALNRAGVPWTLEVVQALDALKAHCAQGENTP